MLLELTLSGLLLLAAYLLGSLPTGYLAGRWLKGIDIREHGSGSTGATNVLRTLGKAPALAVFLIDVVKGSAAIAIIYSFYILVETSVIPVTWKPWLVALAAFTAILGHSKSIWLNFTGGKSVATSLGVLLAMSWQVALGTFGIFAIMLAISRIVSLSSLFGAIAVFVLMILFNQPLPYEIFGVVAGLYVFLRHSSNIQRILAGTEPKIGQPLQSEAQSN
ncbi:MAG: glycerol-3-phosphate 1-O-acyltransferase PlsY [Symploca sp. SIO2C1]|nr:glycerol-3-phosphate 1-O-acyltransferase PlsY [Symploca sp. SIO2C1]